ncbi:glutamyl-tRNA synthetase [Saccharothrix saharensis]|uniref:Glutamate--tRNA ligase n=1 Tax=Saccharothrix saharensis TaxID=571190 RepID=A0A543JKG0_9PSEU|nr:glutamate--tRNA ligase [Saccharothrix saharensis]TQM83303.1 glutamyl-tRNA synthetase [Saccharothrix saharensis]
MSAPAAPPTGADAAVRVRFSPSPTGTPHVGLVRTALFNWAYARHAGGTVVFRIEDTDAARDSEESYLRLPAALRWLGLDWDEGPEVGGPHAPYRQSLRRHLYDDIARRLLEAGELYESFSTAEEAQARREAAGQDPKLGYDGHDRGLTGEQRSALRAEGREPVLRLKMPDEDITWVDLVRGEVTFQAGSTPDPVLVRANGDPLRPFVSPVDDALMGITHVLRGEDLLPSTPRQIALHRALARIGVTSSVPRFGHLPTVLGEGNRKLSKRDPRSDLFHYRDRGFVPEGLLNYLALLGWSTADDRDVLSVAELVEAFELERVSANPARFDLKKAEAINAAHLRALPVEDFVDRVLPHLVKDGVLPADPSPEQVAVLSGVAPLVQERLVVLSEASGMVRFLFVPEPDFAPEADAVAAVLGEDARPVLEAAVAALEPLPEWTAAAIEGALKTSLVDGLGLRPRTAYAPVRVAVTGRTVSPPLYESMELLGRSRSIGRLRRALGAI